MCFFYFQNRVEFVVYIKNQKFPHFYDGRDLIIKYEKNNGDDDMIN